MSTTTSRSALLFMLRSGIKTTRRISMPRLDPGQQIINRIPLDRSQLDPKVMLDAAGDPTPDRGPTTLWPPVQEIMEVIP